MNVELLGHHVIGLQLECCSRDVRGLLGTRCSDQIGRLISLVSRDGCRFCDQHQQDSQHSTPLPRAHAAEPDTSSGEMHGSAMVPIMERDPLRILACGDATALADAVAARLDVVRTPSEDVWFSCGEGKHVIGDNVRGTDVYLFQRMIVPTSPQTVYDRLLMLLHAADAARCADASRITAVLPYFPGSRQDKRKLHVREGVSTGLLARVFAAAGVSMVITVQPHNEAMIGCFDPRTTVFEPVSCTAVLCRWLQAEGLVPDVVASTDVGGLELARGFAKRLRCGLVALSKERDYSQASVVTHSTVIGDPAGRRVLIVDDIIDTAGSMCAAVRSLWGAGATDITVVGIHLLLSGPAWERLHHLADEAASRGVAFQLVGTSAILHPDPPSWYRCTPIEPLLADVIRSVNQRGSVRALETQ